MVAGPFGCNADAWRWIDRQTVARRSEQWRSVKQIVPVTPDAAFWRVWHDNPAAMKRDGYRVSRTSAGTWKAWIERHQIPG
jgi:hypothetical protein